MEVRDSVVEFDAAVVFSFGLSLVYVFSHCHRRRRRSCAHRSFNKNNRIVKDSFSVFCLCLIIFFWPSKNHRKCRKQKKEKRNIKYTYLEKLNRYKSYHSHYAKKPDYEPSKDFLADLNDITYDNEEDFVFSTAYKSLVTAHYRKKAGEIKIEGDKYNSLAMLKVCEGIKSQTIKNTLAYNAAQFTITYVNNVEQFYNAYKAIGVTNEKNNTDIEKKYSVLKKLVKGAPSPKFVNYENYAGGTTSLDDLKGKYTYIDIWATWCGPCIREIPSLKKVEKQYHGKNIQFLSISIDDKKDHQKWKDMIKEKELGGIQLFADNVWESKFVADYYVKGIPKFILLDPQGNIVVPNAPRPSDPKLIELFTELKI